MGRRNEYVLRRAPISYDKFELLLVIVEDEAGKTAFSVQWNKSVQQFGKQEAVAHICTYKSLIPACTQFDQILAVNGGEWRRETTDGHR